jgi:mannitol-1-/sugar-/sorbitol-6-phosphatase
VRVIDFEVEAVLFDLDGTLVDSTASVRRAWAAMADELGVPLADFESYMHGIPGPQVFAAVLPAMPPDEARTLATRMNAEQAGDTDGVRAMPGAAAALTGLPHSRWAIVTSGDQRLATARIAAAGLPRPHVLVTFDDVRAGKPDPECYLVAASRLGRAPARCLVVEDAPAGVAAGRAAGMPVLGVLTTYRHLDADVTAPDLSTVDIHAEGSGVRVVERRN